MDENRLNSAEGIESVFLSDKVIVDDDTTVKAVALQYDNEKTGSAPKVEAKGQGYIARKIIERAEEHGISIVEDGKLADNLMSISIGQQIPAELYEAVAEIYIYLARLDEKVGESYE